MSCNPPNQKDTGGGGELEYLQKRKIPKESPERDCGKCIIILNRSRSLDTAKGVLLIALLQGQMTRTRVGGYKRGSHAVHVSKEPAPSNDGRKEAHLSVDINNGSWEWHGMTRTHGQNPSNKNKNMIDEMGP
ncbi:hypothetical protein TEQG_02507 [Trichophyton equinum CBS 127.97]|uniref:Uncharacterized protein n=1 Tax=Trichophyton equinum (strain ATCC MYA-4606 / CBS 127.97) TaxID=559882 RepID=F2PNK8_TRIEC|nr:hypothetical protein TEQG_02507 [Trichophyton equinum CBS 127.97]